MVGPLIIEFKERRHQAEAVPGHGVEYFDRGVVQPCLDATLRQGEEYIRVL